MRGAGIRRRESAALADAGFEPFGVAFDEFERLSPGGGVAQLSMWRSGCRRAAVGQTERFLKHDADVAAQAGEREVADVGAVDGDKSRLRIERAVPAGAGVCRCSRSDQRHAGNAVKLRSYGVRKGYVGEFEARARAARVSAPGRSRTRHGVEHVKKIREFQHVEEQVIWRS